MSKSRYFCSASALAAALALGLAGQAQAQPGTEVEEVVVTGSFIAGTPEDAALPVDVLTANELEKRGTPNQVELIKSLPVTGPVLGDSNQFSPAAQGRSGGGTINLRALGANRTLVLFNGRRIGTAGAPGGGSADTNLLPIAAIGRTEILKDGAAATYGSDAIGGVVNFISRRNFSGIELAADYRFVDGSDGDWTASLNYGWVGEAGNLFVSLGYQHRSELSTTERDWAIQPFLVNPSGWSVLGSPGAFLPLGPIGPGGALAPVAGVQRDAGCAAVGGFPNFTGTTPACQFTYIPFDNLVEDSDQYQIYAEANADLNDTTRVHIEALYAKTVVPNIRFSPAYPPTSGPLGPGSVGAFTVPIQNPGALTALQQAGLSPGVQALTQRISLTLWRPLGNFGNPVTGGLGGQSGSRHFDIFRVSGGVKGEWRGIGWDIAATYSREKSHQETTDILIDRLQRALNGLGGPNCVGNTPGANGCQWFNPFSNAFPGNPALNLANPAFVQANANDPALVGWLFDRQKTTVETDNVFIDAVLNGRIGGFELPGGQIGWAVGAQWRRDEQRTSLGSEFQDARLWPCPQAGVTTCQVRTGPYIFLGQNIPNQLDSSVWAVFGELALPITDAIEAQFAIRHEDYGGETGATTNPQARVRWQVMDWLALRGSVGTTFRGPTAGNRSPNNVTALSGIAATGNQFRSVDLFGNPAIGPEQALTWNVGAIANVGPVTATLDYWSIDLEDQIVFIPANVVATSVAGVGTGTQLVNCASPLRDLITFANNNACIQGVTVAGDIARIRSDTVNGPRIKVSGVDFQADASVGDVMGGRVGAGVSLSYIIEYKQDAFMFRGVQVSPAYDAVGFANYDRLPGTLPEWRANAYLEWERDIHTIRAQLTHIEGVIDNRAPITVQNETGAVVPITFGMKVDDFTTLDLTYRAQLPWDTTVTASVLNVFDTDPSQARLELSYDPFIGNPIGRSFRVGVRKRF